MTEEESPNKNSSSPGRVDSGDDQPSQIGPYRILYSLGEGGMSVVYLAEQSEPVKRRVALKILKPGMDSKQIVARFESERQALAILDHPNIAKIFDGGIAESGRPYFVMEQVKGVAITDYCDDQRLSNEERLKVFIKVCSAVQHAHLKGLIHRDLKPSNILVGVVDGNPEPKIIDFGIAKATSATLTDSTLYTRVGQIIGTPQYMSPEQADLTGLDIDTRADIYSLGVVLYELLVGTVPLDLRAIGDQAMQVALHEKDPPKPSTRFTELGDTREEIARVRGTEPNRLRHQLKGDLDWVVMRAIEKDRTRRYETANALAMECRRFLNHEPVLARSPSPGYLLRRFVRRNRLVVAAGTIAMLAILAGAAAATLGFIRAIEAEQVAVREAETARQVSDFLVDLFEVSDPSEARGYTITAREVLDRGTESIDAKLGDQPAVRATLMATMGEVYRKLGLYTQAQALIQVALDIQRRALGDDHPETLRSMNRLGIILDEQGRNADAEPLFFQTLAARKRVLGDDHADTLRSMSNLAVLYESDGRYDEAEPLYLEALETQKRVLGDEHIDTLRSANNVAELYRTQARYDEAEPLYTETLNTQRRVFGNDHPDTIRSLNNLASLYRNLGRIDEAEPLYVEALETRKRVLGIDHPETLETMNDLANVYRRQGRDDAAEALHLETVEAYKRVRGIDHPDTAAIMSNLAELYRQQGRYDEAEPLYLQGLETQMRLGANHPNTGAYQHNLACLYRDTGRYDESQLRFERAQQIWEETLPPDHPFLVENLSQWALLYRKIGDDAEADKLETRASELQEKS